MNEAYLAGHAEVSSGYLPERRLNVRVSLSLVKSRQAFLGVVGEEQLEKVLAKHQREKNTGGSKPRAWYDA